MSKEKTTQKRQKKNNSVLHTVLSLLFSFLLALSLMVFSFALVARVTLSETYVKHCLDQSYYNGLFQNLEDEVRDYTIPTGIDVSVVEGVFDKASTQLDVEAYIDGTFKVRQYMVDTSKQEQKLRDNVLEYLKSQDVPTEPVNPAESEEELDEESVNEYNAAVEETNRAVDEYVKDIMEIYRKKVKISAMDYLVKYGNDYQKYFPFVLIISILFAVINGFLCMKVHSLPHRGLRYLVYAFTAGFIMTFAAPFGVFAGGFYNRLNIRPEYFKNFISSFIRGALVEVLVVAAAWLLIALGLLLLTNYFRKKSLHSD